MQRNILSALKTIVPPLADDKLIEIDSENPDYIPYRVNQLISTAILAEMTCDFSICLDDMAPVNTSLVDGQFSDAGDIQPFFRRKILNATITRGQYDCSKPVPVYCIRLNRKKETLTHAGISENP